MNDRLHAPLVDSNDARGCIKEIAVAWDKLAIPDGFIEVGGAGDESGEFRALFDLYGHKYWKSLVDADLRSGYGHITLMNSDTAKAYYLAAHLVRCLREFNGPGDHALAYDLAETIECLLQNIHRRGNFSVVFNREQIVALKRFVGLLREVYGGERESLERLLDAY